MCSVARAERARRTGSGVKARSRRDGGTGAPERMGTRPVPPVDEPVEETRAKSVPAARRIDDRGRRRDGNVQRGAVRVDLRSEAAHRDDQGVDAARDRVERQPGALAQKAPFVVVDREV